MDSDGPLIAAVARVAATSATASTYRPSALPADLRWVLDCTFPPEDPDELAAVLPIIKAACPRPEYLPWAKLHKRTHGVDLLPCACGGRRRVVAIGSG